MKSIARKRSKRDQKEIALSNRMLLHEAVTSHNIASVEVENPLSITLQVMSGIFAATRDQVAHV